MKTVLVPAMDGVDEVECLTTVDFCRRGGLDVTTASITGKKEILGSHSIVFCTDALLDEVVVVGFGASVYPGCAGTPALGGARHLAEKFLAEGKLVAAICAAPGMLSEGGFLKGKAATGYPGCQPEGMANWTEALTEKDGRFISGKGPGAAPYFALEIIKDLLGEEQAETVRIGCICPIPVL